MYSSLPFLCTLALSVIARPLAILDKRATPLPPYEDPFYLPPAGFASAAPGTILNSRTVTVAYGGQRQLSGVNAYQLLYRTTSANTTALATVVTVLQPTTNLKNQVISFQFAEDSDNNTAAPSYQLQYGASQTGTQPIEALFMQGYLNQGYIVAVPDYETYQSVYGNGIVSGHAVLDGLKATLNYKPLKLAANTPLATYGYSGGAIATGWASALQGSYAPGLNVVGHAMGGVPANLSATLIYLNENLFAGFVFASLAGQLRGDQGLQQTLSRISTPAAQTAYQLCYNNGMYLEEYAYSNFLSTEYQSDGANFLYDPYVQPYLQKYCLGNDPALTPVAPVLIFQTQDDEIIPVAQATALVDDWCNHGIKSLIYTIDTGPAEHISGEILWYPEANSWLNARFAGAPKAEGCVRNTTVLPLLDPGAAPEGLEYIYSDLLTILTGQVGVDDSIYIASLESAAAKLGKTPASSPTTLPVTLTTPALATLTKNVQATTPATTKAVAVTVTVQAGAKATARG